ncbi:TadE-like protein [Nitrosospira multiformis ATCC 25196]|uniref:TadE-like protein n=1 Tax=Nitrosospira multiformis (strain ATCC 25196 / NCIMB 11849 / C 71) TaxID=323848 RepID=A0A1H5W0G2_NITMU|nr:TadE/TadG family type IV pilus assembly protein [Nitrosospira multiformis]SEF92903.1 TadE-like protein [Nitrosospira multiformis ATCC 25196]
MNARRSCRLSHANRFRQRGAAAVEFALIASLLFILLFGIIEMGRVLFYWNTATEATRLGARLAVVCAKDAAIIKTRMGNMLSILTPGTIEISYDPSGCDASSCRSVTVSITGLNVSTFIPFVPLNLSMPPFATTLPRESMGMDAGGEANPDCS